MDMIFSHAEQHRRHLERQKRLWASRPTTETQNPVSEPVRREIRIPVFPPSELQKLKTKLTMTEDEVARLMEKIDRKDREISRLERELDVVMRKLEKHQNIIESTHEVLKGELKLKKTMNEIALETLLKFPFVTMEAVRGASRSRHILEARFAVIQNIAIQRPDLSHSQIAAFINRERTSVLNVIRKMVSNHN